MGRGPSTRTVVRIALAVAGTALALYVLYLIRSTVELVVLAVFLALALGPFVDFLTRHRAPRPLAILGVYLGRRRRGRRTTCSSSPSSSGRSTATRAPSVA
jgi:hypothetical protein